jgi:hypothetical protein
MNERRKIVTNEKQSDTEYRIDVRGSGGKITRVRILERKPGGPWERCGDTFTDEHGIHFRQSARVVGRYCEKCRAAVRSGCNHLQGRRLAS